MPSGAFFDENDSAAALKVVAAQALFVNAIKSAYHANGKIAQPFAASPNQIDRAATARSR
ncbi:MAG: hypothetical protein KGL35_24290 [Bradyrhizobium sp.]|nr:hypothetical protein [Bradyrhizobium sp.]